MMKIYLFCLLLLGFSCSPANKFNQDKALFESSAVQLSFTSVADMNDSYFVIKDNHFFEFYRQLFDSVKNTSFPGKYTKNGDTLMLHFYDKKGASFLGKKAWINKDKNEIIFFKN